MNSLASLLAAGALLASQAVDAQQASSPCRANPERVGQCRQVHGRLAAYNGNPTFRIWILGTHRLLGVPGPSPHDTQGGDMLPPALRTAFGPDAFQSRIIADFRICPLTRERAGSMQFVCIERATNLHVRRL